MINSRSNRHLYFFNLAQGVVKIRLSQVVNFGLLFAFVFNGGYGLVEHVADVVF